MWGQGSIAGALTPLVDLVYPPRCPVCGDAIGEQAGLCPSCWAGLAIPADPSCALCQRPFDGEAAGDTMHCAPCLAEPPRHDGIAAGTLYNDVSRRLVLAFKHGRRIALAPMLARLMAARLRTDGEALLVPVPLHRWRLWGRGFNQAVLLGKELEKLGCGRMVVDGLVRKKPTRSLGGLGAPARRRALSGAIGINPKRKERFEGAEVVLVDDVLTSGATSDACVAALKRAGARSVSICCFARVL